MPLLSINRSLPPGQLRLFGVVCLGVLGIMAWRTGAFGGSTTAAAICGVVACVVLAGFVSIPWMRRLLIAVSWVTFPIGLVLSYLILAVVFYLVFTPIGIVMRLGGRDVLRRKSIDRAESFWIPRKAQRTLKSYLEQF
ncbi:MAG: SxtJ family membrane protein [Opitutaceae bacterium]|nr:SxtJ family membrane protein [Opitutaceae bacterium]